MKSIKRLFVSIVLSLAMIASSVLPNFQMINIKTVNAESKITLNKSKTTIYVGNSIVLKVTGTKKKVKWITSKKSVATVSKNGKVTGKKVGKATITANVGGKSYKCKVTVKKVALTKKKVTLHYGKSTTIKLNGGTIKSVKSSNTSIATINKSGKITAKKVGIATMTVTSTKKKKYTCKVTVTAYLSSTKLTLAKGDSKTVKLNGAKIKSVKSNKTAVATINKSGKIIAKGKGTATITIKDSAKKKYTCKVTVEVPVLSKTTLSIEEGKTAILKLNNNTQKVVWSSSNKNIVTVNSSGKVTAKAAGIAKITVKVTSGKKYSCKVTVKKVDVEKYTVTFNSNGGSVVKSQIVKKGGLVIKPTDPTRSGYNFDGWFTAASSGQKFDFNTEITDNITLYAHWTAVSSATDYYKNNAELIEIVKVEKSDDVLTETESKSLLESRGFGDNPILYDYSIAGNRIDDTEVTDGSTNVHPMYQTLYLSQNGEAWAIYVINGRVFANPVSFNLESNLEAQLLVSESKTLTSYDDATNQFYVTIPHASEIILQTVEKIDAETLDRLTIKEICKFSGATVSSSADEYARYSKSATAFTFDDSYALAPVSTIAKYSSDDPLIVVSLGDSYSSGEGIEKFFGQDKALNDKVRDDNWLAHRSTKSWPSLLKVPGIEGTLVDYMVPLGSASSESCRWYFAAASGATTWHFQHEFRKDYHRSTGWFSDSVEGCKDLPRQLDAFNNIRDDVDYVTLTIGGNDVRFADVVTTCAVNCAYLHFGAISKLENQLNDTWAKFSTTRDNIKKVYEDIKEAAGPQAAIIVAGYPQLLEPNGKGPVIDKKEAQLVDTNVSRFNDEIESIVNECRRSGMNIYFVDVESEFSDHLAYSNSPWINKIIFAKQEQDLSDKGIGSAYSVHPNEQGAQAYARCVNAKIEEIENSKEETNYNRYEIYDLGMTWNEAKEYCESLGGHLATITSQQEQNYIESILPEGKEYYWIGGKRLHDLDEQWTWVTGETFDYTNWAEGQPDNGFSGGESYLGITARHTSYADVFQWNDYTNEGSASSLSNAGFICEWDNKN